MNPPLLSMPVEVLCAIFVLLDPISLIATSQTSRALRKFIDPTRDDFVQRLLALELLPESGGIVPHFRLRDSSIAPPMGSPEWHRNKYACSLCLKLRSYTWFDNHSILRLRLRKPPPGSQEATKLTPWEPLDLRDPAARWKRAQRRAAAEKERLAPERAAYHQYSTGVGFPGLAREFYRHNYDNFDFGPADKRAGEAERALCGTERHKRACNQCRHLRGDWSHPGRVPGRPGAPIVTSWQVSLPHLFERHFPGLLDFLHKRNPDPALAPPATYPRGFGTYSCNQRHDTWTLYTAYCGSCSQWQELAGFGYYAWHSQEIPTVPLEQPKHQPFPWPASCNQCSRKEDPSAYSQRISRDALEAANEVLDAVAFRFAWGWNILRGHFDQRLQRFRRTGQLILDGLPWKPPTGKDQYYQTLDLDVGIIPELRVRLERWRLFLRDELPVPDREHYVQGVFKICLEDHQLNEAVYLQIKTAIAMMEEQPGIVEMYIAEREPYRL